ncbi:RNA ligase [Methylobacterium sp. EM32]|uniref:RNA ligase n=1 Tax=Methylobacterium sp. EM32 TaxID=3163481 RepID=UPI0033B257EE
MARGLILDPATRAAVATPFPKFFNLGERGAAAPDLPFEAFEKLDGSLIVAFHHAGRWRAATKGAFDSSQAAWAQARLNAADTSGLVPGTTYLFEAIYPENVIVVRYAEPEMAMLAAYDAAGRELTYAEVTEACRALGWRPAKRFAFASMEAMAAAASVLTRNEEGFVVRFADGYRLKLKEAEYKRIHALITRCTPLAVWDVMAAWGDPAEMRRDLPEEFWADFDAIHRILQTRFMRLAASVRQAAEDVANLSDKELGLRLSEVPEAIRPFVFPFRKATNDEARAKLRVAMLRTIRPTGNVLEGYVPSFAMDRALSEAA